MIGKIKEMANIDPSLGTSIFFSVKISDSLFKKFSDLIYQKAGIYLKPEKGKRLRACGFTSFAEYYNYVTQDKSGIEIVNLLDCISTNFTSFFREQAHFDLLDSHVLPSLMDRGKRNNEILLWSAACSSGEEPYSMAIILEEFVNKNPGLRYTIKATDISTKVLAHAQRGVYSKDKVTNIPKQLLKKYFQKGVGKSEGFVRIKGNVRSKIIFKRFNLMDEFPGHNPCDVVFCRNVMIYFNRATQQKLIDKFYQVLSPDGYLFIGHSESLANLKHNFKQVAATAYCK